MCGLPAITIMANGAGGGEGQTSSRTAFALACCRSDRARAVSTVAHRPEFKTAARSCHTLEAFVPTVAKRTGRAHSLNVCVPDKIGGYSHSHTTTIRVQTNQLDDTMTSQDRYRPPLHSIHPYILNDDVVRHMRIHARQQVAAGHTHANTLAANAGD